VKIAHIVLTLDRGGLERLVIQKSRGLQQRDVRCLIIALKGGALADEARQAGVETILMGKPDGFTPTTVPTLARLLRAHGVDVVHTHNMAPLFYGTLAARLCGLPSLNTRHGRTPERAHRLVWALADRVVAVSEDARRELLRHNRIADHKLHVILNGIDLSGFAEGRRSEAVAPARARLGLPLDAPVVGTVGRLAAVKDHETLLRAFGLLRQGGSDAHLAVIGGGPLEADLKSRVRALGLDGVAHIVGPHADVPHLLPALDVFVLSSLSEGISLALIEAMAAGLPVVATRVGGNPEVVVEGRTGLLVEPSQPEALRSALLRVLSDRAAAQVMGVQGRRRALEMFGLERMLDRYVALYEEVRSRETTRAASDRPLRRPPVTEPH